MKVNQKLFRKVKEKKIQTDRDMKNLAYVPIEKIWPDLEIIAEEIVKKNIHNWTNEKKDKRWKEGRIAYRNEHSNDPKIIELLDSFDFKRRLGEYSPFWKKARISYSQLDENSWDTVRAATGELLYNHVMFNKELLFQRSIK